MSGDEKAIVMAIKPKYAKAIYEGRKNWEFRKAPPPLFKYILVYESAPVSRITGRVMFSVAVTGCSAVVFDMVSNYRTYNENRTGITNDALAEYAGRHVVTALRVCEAERFAEGVDIRMDARPPQNWGRFAVVKKTPTVETTCKNCARDGRCEALPYCGVSHAPASEEFAEKQESET